MTPETTNVQKCGTCAQTDVSVCALVYSWQCCVKLELQSSAAAELSCFQGLDGFPEYVFSVKTLSSVAFFMQIFKAGYRLSFSEAIQLDSQEPGLI